MRRFLNPRVYIALGLVSLAASVLLAAAALGLVPDREAAVSQARISLAEVLANGNVTIIADGDRTRLHSLLKYAIKHKWA